MARNEALFVFCYDIESDSARRKVSDVLESGAVRVQKSVFEGFMAGAAARRLAQLAGARLGPDDSLRVYAVTADGRRASFSFGPLPMPDEGGLYVL